MLRRKCTLAVPQRNAGGHDRRGVTRLDSPSRRKSPTRSVLAAPPSRHSAHRRRTRDVLRPRRLQGFALAGTESLRTAKEDSPRVEPKGLRRANSCYTTRR